MSCSKTHFSASSESQTPQFQSSTLPQSHCTPNHEIPLNHGLTKLEIIFFSLYKLHMKLKVLRCSPDLLNNVKIGRQLQLIMEQSLFYHIGGLQPFWSSDLNNLMNNPSNSPEISEKKMFR